MKWQIFIFLLLSFTNFLFSQPYREIIDKNSLLSENKFVSFSGNNIIFRENHIFYGKDEFGKESLQTRCNFFKLKIFSTDTEKQIFTIDYKELISGTELEKIYNGECNENFFLNWYKDNTKQEPIKIVSYGNIMAVLFQLSHKFKQQYLKVYNILDGSLLFSKKIISNNKLSYTKDRVIDIDIDNEKIVIYTHGYVNNCIDKKTGLLSGFVEGIYSLSFYYYKTGEFKEDFIKMIGYYILKNLKENFICKNLTYNVVLGDNNSKILYSFPKKITNSNKNFVLLENVLINVNEKTVEDLYKIDPLKRNFLYEDGYHEIISVTEKGDIFFGVKKDQYSPFFSFLKIYNKKNNEIQNIYKLIHKDKNGVTIIDSFLIDNETTYIISNTHEEIKQPLPYKELICPLNKSSCQWNEKIPIIKTFYYNFWITGNSISAGIPGYNLYRLDKNTGRLIPITNDFCLKNTGFIKNGNFITFNYSIYNILDYIDQTCIDTENKNVYSEWEVYSPELKKYVYSCRIIKIKEITNDNKTVLFIGNVNSLSNYPKIIKIYPVVPYKSTEPSIFYQGSNFYRTFQLKFTDESPVKNAEVLSTTLIKTFSDIDGYVNVKNNYSYLSPGEYKNKSIKDIILNISIDEKPIPFVYITNESDNFSFIVKDSSYTEKKFILETGGSIEAGIGVFRTPTIRAAGIDLTGKVSTGIYFNLIKDKENFFMEIGRNLTSGVGVKSVLAEADIYGVAEGKVETGIMLSGVGTQIFKINNPFAQKNENERKILTGFLWDTLFKNEILFFPGIGKIMNWIWENIDFFNLKKTLVQEKAGVQVSGSVTAGIELPILSIRSKDIDFKSENWENIGLNLPSLSGEFTAEHYLNRYFNSNLSLGYEMNISAKMDIEPSIFNFNIFSSLPKLPDSTYKSFGIKADFDLENNVKSISILFSGEKKENDLITGNELIIDIKTSNLTNNISKLPENLREILHQNNLSMLSWDTKDIKSFFKQTLNALGDSISGNIKIFKTINHENEYKFEIGFGAGLEFGVGAFFRYIKSKRKFEKNYNIDSFSHGIAITEDFSNTKVTYFDKSLEEIFALTLEYLRDIVKNLFNSVKKEISKGVEYIINKGNCAIEIFKDSFSSDADFYLTVYTPESSEKNITISNTNILPSTTVGNVALINVYNNNKLLDNFSISITLSYSSKDLTNANLSENEEKYLFLWKFRGEDHSYVKVCNNIKLNDKKIKCKISSNGIYGIGYDRTPPKINLINLKENNTLYEDYLLIKISDDFSGIDINYLLIKIDNLKWNNYKYDSITKLLILTNLSEGNHSIDISIKDTAGNEINIKKQILISLKNYQNDDKYYFVINKGWNLKALPFKTSYSSDSFNNDIIVSIWKWKNSMWYVWSPLNTIKEIIEKYNMKTFNKINFGEGFWINSKKYGNIVLNKMSNEYSSIYDISISNGWNLVGSGIKTEITDIKSKFSSIKTLWQWKNGTWRLWSPVDEINNLIKKYKIKYVESIEKCEGFWVYK